MRLKVGDKLIFTNAGPKKYSNKNILRVGDVITVKSIREADYWDDYFIYPEEPPGYAFLAKDFVLAELYDTEVGAELTKRVVL